MLVAVQKKRTWTRKPKGVPAVRGDTLAERAQIIRYYMTKDAIGEFAKRFVKCPRSVWSDIENGRRDMSKAVEDRLIKIVPGLERGYIRDNSRSGMGEGLAAIVAQAHRLAPPTPTIGTRRTTRSS